MFREYNHRVDYISDFNQKYAKNKFVVLVEDTISYMGADYGPPDPPPSMEHERVIRAYSFENEEQVTNWIKNHIKQTRPAPYQIFKVESLSVKTEVKLSLGD